MSNLLGSLLSSANSLRAFDRALSAIQNNVANASTPGYARQIQTLAADRFLPEEGLAGGVLPGDIISRRSDYAERAVRERQSSLGYASQQSASLQELEPLFAPIEGAGIPGAWSRLLASFSQLSVSPGSVSARQVVLDRADALARSVRETASGVQEARSATDRELRSTTDTINSLLERIRSFNLGRRGNASASVDGGVDANLHAALEDLSELVNFQAIEADDGSLTIMLGGSQTVLIGDHVYPVSAEITDGGAVLRNAQGIDVTGQLNGGRLGALVEHRNTVLPEALDRLDRLANSLGTEVNAVLAGGIDLDGNTPQTPLFRWSAEHPALTFGVNTISPRELAAADAGSPGGNARALRLASLGSARDIAGLDGFTASEYFGDVGANIGRRMNSADDARETQSALLAQAQNMREERQGVSLDEEAALLMAYQKSYEASARVIKVLDEMTDTLLSVVR